MGIIDSAIRSISCNGEACTKHVLFDQKDKDAVLAAPENAWLHSTRVVQSADGRNLVYCSDLCEISGVKSGAHNRPETPKVITQTNPAAIAAAAKSAADAKAAEAALRSGKANIQVTD